MNLSVCAETVFLELPFAERVRTLHAAGFGVEIWHWWTKDLDELAATGATFTSMSGYVDGELVDPDGADRLLASAERSIAASRVLGRPVLNLHGTGLDDRGLPVRPVELVTGPMWLAAERTLRRVAELGERHDVVFVLENLNRAVDHPGTPFAAAADVRALVAAVDSPHLRVNLDLYHAQIGEGNLVELIGACTPWLGEVQVADVPGRCEPGTGELNHAALAAALRRVGWTGTVALEAFASGDSRAAVEAFRAAYG